MNRFKLTSVVLALGFFGASAIASPPVATNPVSGTATSKSQGFTESFVSIGANATASQTATATTTGMSSITGSVSDNMAEISTRATQMSSVTAIGSFEGTVGPSTLGSFSSAGAFSFSMADGVATIPSIVSPGNSGNAGGNSGGNAGGND